MSQVDEQPNGGKIKRSREFIRKFPHARSHSSLQVSFSTATSSMLGLTKSWSYQPVSLSFSLIQPQTSSHLFLLRCTVSHRDSQATGSRPTQRKKAGDAVEEEYGWEGEPENDDEDGEEDEHGDGEEGYDGDLVGLDDDGIRERLMAEVRRVILDLCC